MSKPTTRSRKEELENATELAYNNQFWEERLGTHYRSLTPIEKAHLVVSLIIFIGETLSHLLIFIFQSKISAITSRVNRFVAYYPNAKSDEERFAPGTVYHLWHKHRPCDDHLHSMIVDPCLDHIILEESNNLIKDPTLRIETKSLTVQKLKNILHPSSIIEKYSALAPRMWRILYIFSASPNEWRTELQRRARKHGDGQKREDRSESSEDDPDAGGEGEKIYQLPKPEGFLRNPKLAIIVAISMLIFVRNGRTNLLPLILGVFMKVEGTSSRVLKMLSNVGLSVSAATIEKVKEVISLDAVAHAVLLMTSDHVFATVIDNINIFVRKHQQRLTNRNEMINATNCYIMRLDDVNFDTEQAKDLKCRLDQRGDRSQATAADITPTAEDETHLIASFQHLILEFIVKYCPGREKWGISREECKKLLRERMPSERPLKPQKTDARPFGAFDVNEGSKKGVQEVIEEVQKRSTLSQETWAKENRIIGGDWLTSQNIRGAQKDRVNDITPMERVEEVVEVSLPFHFALQASHAIMRAHFGNAVNDPTSLAAHKGLLGRTWDVNTPNYAAAKALIRHSLIARILHIVMVRYGLTRWSQLENWRPRDFDELIELSEWIQKHFASAKEANAAKERGNDWAAHDRFFIRDALIFCVYEQAVSYADAGRMLRVLKYWAWFFRGVGQHNYARECAEILIRFKYEVSPGLQAAIERTWFYNRFGVDGGWIAADLYLEQLNYWVKRVFIASGNGVTVDYIIKRGSACVEAFRSISHLVSRFFGNPDRSRKSKEVEFMKEIQAMVEGQEKIGLHKAGFELEQHFVSAPANKKGKQHVDPQSAIFDPLISGAEAWNSKFSDFLETTSYDEALHGYSRLDNGTVFDSVSRNPLSYDNYEDVHGDDAEESGVGSLGGGGEYFI